jgi:hypothetical protein
MQEIQKNFYTLEWIKKLARDYSEREEKFFVEDKEVGFSSVHFLYALLHIYHRGLLPEFLSEKRYQELIKIRTELEFDFMYLVDILRKEFSYWFKESLLYRDFSPQAYDKLACEFFLLEEQVKKQIQIPLLDQIKKFCINIEEKLEKKEKVELDKEERTLRLLKFFTRVEKLSASLCSRLVDRAKDLVKKASEDKITFENEIPQISIEEVKKELKECIEKETFSVLEEG